MDFFPDEEKWGSLPKSTLTKEGVIIAATLGIWLLRFLNIDKINITSIDNISQEVRNKERSESECYLLWQFLAEIFGFLAEKMPDGLISLLKTDISGFTNLIREDIIGTVLQRSLKGDVRKKLAANYTTFPSSKIICSLLPNKRYKRIIDPFCGSGRLVSAYLDNLREETDFPQLIWINDSHATAVVIAYSRILLSLPQKQDHLTRIVATIGNAFSEISPTRLNTLFDLVLMNPPFTRTHRIDKSQRKALLPLQQQYKKVLKGQPGLHVYGILLADQILSNKGTLAAILPGATFLSTYSKGLQEYFTTEYQIDTILASEAKKSFSEDSNLREIMLVSQKCKPNGNHKVQYHQISDTPTKSEWASSLIRSVTLNNLKSDWNWMRYFHPELIIKFRQRLLKTNKIKSGRDLSLRIVRGVEMYGPDFFFLPNKIWTRVVNAEGGYMISTDKDTIEIPTNYLKKTLRKPGNYQGFISPKVEDYALSIPNNSNDNFKQNLWLKRYIEITHQFAKPAKNKFGDNWIYHISHQLHTKQPWGHLFFADKFGMTTVSNNVFFVDKRITCTKNFYVLVDKSDREAKFLGAWLNSSFYFLLFICSRREIGGSFGRLQIIDYMQEPIFLDMTQCSPEDVEKVITAFNVLRSTKLGPIPGQLVTRERKQLDSAIAEVLQFPANQIRELYAILEKEFQQMKTRDLSRSTRRT